MATNQTTIAASPETIFDLLMDAYSYEQWVVGCKQIRGVDPDWPAVGSKFHHKVGVGPIEVQDNTKIVAAERPHHVRLEVRARPAGVGIVDMTMEADGDETIVTMVEYPTRGIARFTHTPFQEGLIKARNLETLRRLKHLAEERAHAS